MSMMYTAHTHTHIDWMVKIKKQKERRSPARNDNKLRRRSTRYFVFAYAYRSLSANGNVSFFFLLRLNVIVSVFFVATIDIVCYVYGRHGSCVMPVTTGTTFRVSVITSTAADRWYEKCIGRIKRYDVDAALSSRITQNVCCIRVFSFCPCCEREDLTVGRKTFLAFTTVRGGQLAYGVWFDRLIPWSQSKCPRKIKSLT